MSDLKMKKLGGGSYKDHSITVWGHPSGKGKAEIRHNSTNQLLHSFNTDHAHDKDGMMHKLINHVDKGLHKEEMLETTPDGKQEIVEGKEPLKKDPKNRWKNLKKGLNNLESIMDLSATTQQEPEQEEGDEADASMESQEAPTEDADIDETAADEQPDEDSEVDENGSPDEDQSDEISQPIDEEEMESGAGDHGDPESSDEYVDEDLGDEEELDEAAEEADQAKDQGQSEEEIIQALKDEGYSEPEIAYIVHGHHSPTYDESKQAKAHATYAMADVDTDNARRQGDMELNHASDMHKQELENRTKQMQMDHDHQMRMKDLEFQHAQMQSPDPETEKNHKKRMLDLEYEGAKMQMPDGSDKAHMKRMQDLEFQNAQASSPDPEVNKKMQEMDLKERELQLKLKEEQMKLELEFKKKEHELKMKMMQENMKQQAKNKSQIDSEKHKHKLADAKKPAAKKPLKKSFDFETGEVDDE
jgi:hypothetical protein